MTSLSGLTLTHIDSVDMSLSKLREIVKDREAWRAAVHGVAKEPDTTELLNNRTASCKAITNRETSWLPGLCSPYCNCRVKPTFLFWLCLTACRILLSVPRPGIDPAGEVQSPNRWSDRGVPRARLTCSAIGVLLWSSAGGQPCHPLPHRPHQCS